MIFIVCNFNSEEFWAQYNTYKTRVYLSLFKWKTKPPFFNIYLFMRDTQKRQRHRQSQKQAPCREPNTGLDPWTQDYAPSWRQTLNCWATQVSPKTPFSCSCLQVGQSRSFRTAFSQCIENIFSENKLRLIWWGEDHITWFTWFWWLCLSTFSEAAELPPCNSQGTGLLMENKTSFPNSRAPHSP